MRSARPYARRWLARRAESSMVRASARLVTLSALKRMSSSGWTCRWLSSCFACFAGHGIGCEGRKFSGTATLKRGGTFLSVAIQSSCIRFAGTSRSVVTSLDAPTLTRSFGCAHHGKFRSGSMVSIGPPLCLQRTAPANNALQLTRCASLAREDRWHFGTSTGLLMLYSRSERLNPGR